LEARALALEDDLEERMDDYYTESEVSKKTRIQILRTSVRLLWKSGHNSTRG
jgi:hypothetical protein